MTSSLRRDVNMSATNITSKCRIARIELDDAMILAQVANLDGSHFRKGQANNGSIYRDCAEPIVGLKSERAGAGDADEAYE